MVYTGGIFPVLSHTVMRRILMGVQRTRISMGMTINHALLSLCTSFLASKYDPSPRGFGYANSASSWLSLLSILGYLAWDRSFENFGLFKCNAKLAPADRREILKQGALIMPGAALESLFFAIFSGLIGREGKNAAEAFSVANQYARIEIFSSFSSIAGPLGTLMTQHNGPDRSRLKKVFNAGLTLGVIIAAPLLIFSLALPNLLIQPFNAHPDDRSLYQHFLMIFGAGELMDAGIRIPSNGATRPFDRNLRSLVINTAGLGAGFLMAVLSHVFELGPIAMVLGLYMGVSIAALGQAWDVYAAIATPYVRQEEILPLIRHPTTLYNVLVAPEEKRDENSNQQSGLDNTPK